MAKYRIQTITRIQEGASMDDILNGDGYETAYIVSDADGDIIIDTTDEQLAKSYLED